MPNPTDQSAYDREKTLNAEKHSKLEYTHVDDTTINRIQDITGTSALLIFFLNSKILKANTEGKKEDVEKYSLQLKERLEKQMRLIKEQVIDRADEIIELPDPKSDTFIDDMIVLNGQIDSRLCEVSNTVRTQIKGGGIFSK